MYVHTPIRDQKVPYRVAGQGSKIGHTVGRDRLCRKSVPNSLPTLTLFLCLRPPKSITNNHTPILLLVSRPVGRRVNRYNLVYSVNALRLNTANINCSYYNDKYSNSDNGFTAFPISYTQIIEIPALYSFAEKCSVVSSSTKQQCPAHCVNLKSKLLI